MRSSENSRACTSSLLGDWHRINVALTRAKVTLINLILISYPVLFYSSLHEIIIISPILFGNKNLDHSSVFWVAEEVDHGRILPNIVESPIAETAYR